MRYYQLLIAVILSLAVWSCKDEPDVPEGPQLNEQDREAMIEIFRELKMDNNEGFDFNDPKTWPGVQTLLDEEHNEYRVVAFTYCEGIPSNGGHPDDEEIFTVKPRPAGARLSPAFGKLTALQILHIFVPSERFGCPIPPEIFDCPLVYLSIQGLGQYGSGYDFPEGIEKLKGTIKEISFVYTKFVGEIPEGIKYLANSQLKCLDLSNCEFRGNLPAWTSTFSCWTCFANNNLTGIDWEFFKNPNITHYPLMRKNLMGNVVVPDWVTKTEGWKNFPVENKQHRNGNLKYEDGTDTVWP